MTDPVIPPPAYQTALRTFCVTDARGASVEFLFGEDYGTSFDLAAKTGRYAWNPGGLAKLSAAGLWEGKPDRTGTFVAKSPPPAIEGMMMRGLREAAAGRPPAPPSPSSLAPLATTAPIATKPAVAARVAAKPAAAFTPDELAADFNSKLRRLRGNRR